MGNELHNRIAVLRAERKLSRQELADALGINFQTIGFLERGDYSPSLTLALDLSDYFGLPVEAIFSRHPLKPLSETIYGEKSGGEKSGGEKSGGEKSGGEKSGGEKSGGDKPSSNKSDPSRKRGLR